MLARASRTRHRKTAMGLGDPAFSRTGTTSPLGKLTEPVGPYKLAPETKEILEREARRAGLTLNEFLRDLAMIRAHGAEVIAKLYDERIAVVRGKGGES